jgi:hypothetical protein
MKNPKVAVPWRILIAMTLVTGALAESSAQTLDNRDIYSLANRVADDVELIREVMGRPYDDSPRLPASEVTPLELFFTSRTLFRKANQLAQQLNLADATSAPPAPPEGVGVREIFELIDAASGQIGLVKQGLGITIELEPLRRQSGISITGIFMTIIDTNRQLNLLLDEPIQPADVFAQTDLVNSFAGGIIERLAPGLEPIPLPPFETHHTPAEVYSKLLRCLDLVNRIASRVEGASIMSLSSRRNIPDDIEPGHVYDIAVIIVADIATLATALGAGGASLDLPVPDRIFPTEVFQRASLLEQQLIRIEELL